MPAHLTMLWRTLSAHLRHDPEILALRLDHLEGRVESLEKDWVPHPEVQMVETPVGPMPIKLVVIGLLLIAIFRPDLLSKLIP